MEERKLMDLISSGDTQAYIQIMEKYNKLLWVIVGGILNNTGTSEDVEECISDVYLSLWKNPAAFDNRKGSLKTFLSVLARRRAVDKYRQLTKIKIIELDEAISASDGDLLEYIAKQDSYRELYDAIRLQGEPDKEILIRRYFFDEKPTGIAEKTHLSVKEVKNRLYQSKLRLHKILSEKEISYNGTY